ncbi:MAG: hypothetical protein FWF05_00075 [Oscillospiraceae bacterium]|nr:hypothetical protein [Oscillospiraceae bacterium]
MINFDLLWDRILKMLRYAAAFLLAPVVLLTGSSASVMQLYGGEAMTATRRDYIFDNDRLLLGAWNNGLSEDYGALPVLAREAGLDFLVSVANDDFLDLCGAAGIGVIAAGYNEIPSSFMSFTEEIKAQWLALTPETHKTHPALWGDNVVDEPFTRHMPNIGEAISHYHSLDSRRMPYINLLPMHDEDDSKIPLWKKIFLFLTTHSDGRFDSYRQHVGAYIKYVDTDYICTDIYPYHVEKTSDTWLNNLDILAEACRDTGRDLWVITQAAGNVTAVYPEQGNSQRWADQKCHHMQQGYASMAFGAKAIIYACFQDGWWDPDSHMITAGGEPTDTYYAVRAANAEFAPFADIYGGYEWRGAYLVNPIRMAGNRYPALSNGLPKKGRLPVSSKDGLVIGCFDKREGSGKAYVVVNMNELLEQKAALCTLTFPVCKKVTVYGGGEIEEYENGGKVTLALGPGDGKFITVGT